MTYLPPHFREDDPSRLQELIDSYPLATLVAHDEEGLHAHHIPLLFERRGGEHGTLIGHVARNNALWSSSPGDEVLAIFQAADAFITPNWYATKLDTHEVVPTWNYAVVHAWGSLVVHDDEKWLRAAVGKLTKVMEQTNTAPWKMGDAPQDYLRAMLGHIVGIEIPIHRIVGKWKTSQNRNDADRAGVVEGLRSRGGANDLLMAELILERDSDD